MEYSSRMDEWLDKWEEAQQSGDPVGLDQFIEKHCKGAPPDLVARFRKEAQLLASINARLETRKSGSRATGREQTPGANEKRADLRPGCEILRGYFLESRLGRGGFGEVWRASAPGGIAVAIKFVALERRVRAPELRALEVIKGIRHPNLLSIFGAHQQDGYLLILMELADRTLLDRLREVEGQGYVGIPIDELLEYTAEAAKGLDYLHQPRTPADGGPPRSIQHRDIKPQNLLLSGGSVKVGDFGLVRFLENNLASHTGSMTTAYAAPEFFQQQTSNQSDQYSLAVSYCQLRSGRLPFTGSPVELMVGHREKEPDLSMLPPSERPVVRRALAKSPDERWPSCGAFAKELRRATDSASTVPERRFKTVSSAGLATPTAPGSVPSPSRRWRKLFWAGLTLAVVVILALTLSFWIGPFALQESRTHGVGDTILKYEDRSYDGSSWKKLKDAASLNDVAGDQGELYGVVGWDDDNFWISREDGRIFQYRDGQWVQRGKPKDASDPALRLLDAETAILASGADKPAHLYEISQAGTTDRGNINTILNRNQWRMEICVIAPDLYYTFGQQHGNEIGVVKMANGVRADMPENKYKESLVHEDDNTSLKEYPVRNIQYTRSPVSGKAFGIATSESWNYGKPSKIAVFRNGIWYALEDLSKVKIKIEVNDAWFNFQGHDLRAVVLVGNKGYVHSHSLHGAKIDQSISPAQEATSADLIKVWGVGREKFWVMDKNGTVWERKGSEWRIVVRGMFRDGVEFVDAWVSPKGKVVAVTKKQVYCLE